MGDGGTARIKKVSKKISTRGQEAQGKTIKNAEITGLMEDKGYCCTRK